MKHRIAIWASAGFVVACFWAGFWALYPKAAPVGRVAWTLAAISQPIALAGFHFPLSFYWVVLANTATYGLVGLIVETVRQRLNRAH